MRRKAFGSILSNRAVFCLVCFEEHCCCIYNISFGVQENKELRLALEEHQNVMELIMSKYRQQVAQLVTVNSQPSQPSTQEQAKVIYLAVACLVNWIHAHNL